MCKYLPKFLRGVLYKMCGNSLDILCFLDYFCIIKIGIFLLAFLSFFVFFFLNKLNFNKSIVVFLNVCFKGIFLIINSAGHNIKLFETVVVAFGGDDHLLSYKWIKINIFFLSNIFFLVWRKYAATLYRLVTRVLCSKFM